MTTSTCGSASSPRIKRDPFGRTARQVEEVLETEQPYGVSAALAEVLEKAREHLEANECAEVARHVRQLLERSGLGAPEFASRIGVPHRWSSPVSWTRATTPSASYDDPHAPAVGPVRPDPRPARRQLG